MRCGYVFGISTKLVLGELRTPTNDSGMCGCLLAVVSPLLPRLQEMLCCSGFWCCFEMSWRWRVREMTDLRRLIQLSKVGQLMYETCPHKC